MSKYLNAALVCILLVVGVPEAHADWRVWTVTDTTRVLRDAPAQRGSAVKLAVAGNEWAAKIELASNSTDKQQDKKVAK